MPIFRKKSLADYIRESMKKDLCNTPVNFKNSSDKVIIDFFRKLCNDNSQGVRDYEKKFYGGITNDIPQNLSRHGIPQYIGCVRVRSKETAARIEGLLHSELGV